VRNISTAVGFSTASPASGRYADLAAALDRHLQKGERNAV
jgi:hypothetical protein